jgi:putative transport protein
VLFVGLFIGSIAPKANIAGPIGLVGLTMFLYGIGILYGRQFFEGLSGSGRTYNLLALVAVVAGLLVALLFGWAFEVRLGHTLGLFAGSMTSTAALQAALDVMQSAEPSIGYSVAYPFGVIGPGMSRPMLKKGSGRRCRSHGYAASATGSTRARSAGGWCFSNAAFRAGSCR